MKFENLKGVPTRDTLFCFRKEKLMYVTYSYDGPVLEFGKVVTQKWSSSTFAPTEGKARSNLAFQYKKQFHKEPSAKITLPGKLTKHVRKENIS